MNITIPEFSLILLVGPSGSGKSTFAKKHFKPTEIMSSDFFRGLVADDETDQSVTPQAFEILNFIVKKRLEKKRLTVIDATNVEERYRRQFVELARSYHFLTVAIVFDLSGNLCLQRNEKRKDRNFGPHVVHRQIRLLRESLRGIKQEGFYHVYILSSPEEVEQVTIKRERLRIDKRDDCGPFDIIGDVHGCFDELTALLKELGYFIEEKADFEYAITAPAGRKVVFLGDLVDRGPKIVPVLRLAMSMVYGGQAICVPGNHDMKLLRKLGGKNVKIAHGLAESLEQLQGEPAEFIDKVKIFFDQMVSHYQLDGGRLIVAHAGLKSSLQGRTSKAVRAFSLYGETTGETDEFGLPVRHNWAAQYRGQAMVVYGHTPVPEAKWLNNTINIDTGCVFGGRLSALRYPEKEVVSVPAAKVYSEPRRLFLSDKKKVFTQQYDGVLDIEDVYGKRIITTRLNNIKISEEHAAAALEVMSRFAVDPRWLIYLPATMSPCGTSKIDGFLEHPQDAFQYYRKAGVTKVVCQEKHMGSRLVLIVCRDSEIACQRFEISGENTGICYTRTGRRFFGDLTREKDFITRVRNALDKSGIWQELSTDWIALDCELLPWNAKAQSLITWQYAAIGAAAHAALPRAVKTLRQAAAHGAQVEDIIERCLAKSRDCEKFVRAYRRYCWPVDSIADLRLAPFCILAAKDRCYMDKEHAWHMDIISGLCECDAKLLKPTQCFTVEVREAKGREQGIDWWLELTEQGAEGMVVKPLIPTVKGRRGLAQPALKCRGQEYLRIIYGPDYMRQDNLKRLRTRELGRKRSLALREFSLGLEALERFVRREPLRRVHECVFGILALESDPVDPRL